MSDNYNDLLGGKPVKSASFKGQFPIEWGGKVEEVTKNVAYEYDPSKPNNRGAQKFWADGNPVMNLWITLLTDVREDQDDDGKRVLVLDSKNKLEAVQQAVRESKADFAKGGYLRLQWYGNDPAGKNPDNPPKLYRAQYTGPTFNDALAGPAQPAAQQAPPTQGGWGAPATPAPAQGGWGQAAPAAPAPQATGGWGEQAPAAPAQGGWGQQAPAAAPAQGGWGAPPAPAAPQIDPGLVAALEARGVPRAALTSQEQAEQIAATLGLTRG